MRHLFIMDPIAGIRIDQDSTFALMMEAQRRGHESAYVEPGDLYLDEGRSFAFARGVKVAPVQGEHYELSEGAAQDLSTFDVVWMRKDPPFDMEYIFTTYILDIAAQETLVVNDPAGLRHMNEKAWPMRFPSLIPESLVTSCQTRLRAFVARLGVAVVKPLDGCGGDGVFVVRSDDPNIGVILETSTRHGQQTVMAQRYLPEAKAGDKRVILVEGEPVGAILRVPTGIDHRGNIHVGARVVGAELTARDRVICAQIGPALREAGQIFTGIDVIGDYLTEVNVTSPTGIHEVNAAHGVQVEGLLLDAVAKRL